MGKVARYLTIAGAVLLAAPSVATVMVTSSGATATSLTLSAAGVLQANATIAPVSGAGGAAYDRLGGVAATNQSWLLVDGILTDVYDMLTLGAVTTEASGSTSGLATATGTTTIASVGSTLQTTTLGIPLIGLGITTGAITSSATAAIAADGHLYGTNSASIANFNLTGSLLSGLTLDLVTMASAAPNTVALNLLGLKLVLNEQLQTFVSTNDLLVQTNAMHLTLSNYSYGGSILSGEVIIGHSQAEIAAVPEPATWGMMLVGFGGIGFAMRRARKTNKLAGFSGSLSSSI
jgi:hypothetical protein